MRLPRPVKDVSTVTVGLTVNGEPCAVTDTVGAPGRPEDFIDRLADPACRA